MPEDQAHNLIAQIIAAMYRPAVTDSMPAVDIADMRSLLLDAGPALYGSGEASGEGRATKAAELAIADIKRQLREAGS